ncbi:MAG: 30S ribosomal protein S12 methylthiotransferase RimO [Ignavibacteria bacterium]|nr:30S ribosomal protein S12 methylthiotransferase RimO [Ignavibacteria bacterium]
MKKKISVVTLGCSKNTVDSERLLNQIKLNRFTIQEEPDEVDAVIINTCGFIEAAKEESIAAILEAVKAKEEGRIGQVIVTGCLSERYKDDLRKEIPEVDSYFGTEEYGNVIREIGGELKSELLGERLLTTPSHTAYLKISEGCDHPCSFCAIPLIRGKHHSVPLEELLGEAASLAKKGTKELVIIGQDTTDYGIDLYGKRIISELLHKLSGIEGIEWVRLMYAYPSHFPDDLIEEMANNPKICKYLDIPLQHINDEVLKSMRRGITRRRTIDLLHKLRKRIPGIVIRTTFITGYPAEHQYEYEELYDFIKEFKFERLGVFTYSIEENTSAFPLGDTIPEKMKNKRRDTIMKLQQKISAEYNQSRVDTKIRVLIERQEGEFYIGRSQGEAPEVDGEILVKAEGKKLKPGKLVDVLVYDADEYDLFAKLSK